MGDRIRNWILSNHHSGSPPWEDTMKVALRWSHKISIVPLALTRKSAVYHSSCAPSGERLQFYPLCKMTESKVTFSVFGLRNLPDDRQLFEKRSDQPSRFGQFISHGSSHKSVVILPIIHGANSSKSRTKSLQYQLVRSRVRSSVHFFGLPGRATCGSISRTLRSRA
jgi:hypothetical protein